MALHPLALQIIAQQATPRPGLPNPFGSSALTGFSGALAVFDFLSEGDLSGNGYRLTGNFTLIDSGLVLPGGESGLAFGLIPPSVDFTIAIAAKVAPDAAADGYFVSCLDTTANVGGAIKYTLSNQAIQGQTQQANGLVAATTTGITRATDTWFAVAFRTSSALAPPNNVGWLVSNTGQSGGSGSLSARNTPTKNFLIGHGWSTTKGIKGTLGMLAVYDGLKSQTDMTAIIETMRTEMASKHGVTIP